MIQRVYHAKAIPNLGVNRNIIKECRTLLPKGTKGWLFENFLPKNWGFHGLAQISNQIVSDSTPSNTAVPTPHVHSSSGEAWVYNWHSSLRRVRVCSVLANIGHGGYSSSGSAIE